MPEIFATIDEAPSYEISSLGRVRRNGKFLKPSPNTQGYHHVTLTRDGRKWCRPIHVLVCTAFHGPRPSSSHDAAHWDGKKLNNASSNLRWATKKENQADRIRHGTKLSGNNHPAHLRPERQPRGADHPGAKLREEDVIAIRTQRVPGVVMAKHYGVSPTTISEIRLGKTWQHIGEGR